MFLLNRSVILGVVFFIFWTNNSVAEPVGKLAPLTSLSKQSLVAEGKTEADMLEDIPSKEMVGMPAYPDAYFAGAMGDVDTLSALTLMSKDSAKEIISWYKKKLGDEWQDVPELAMEDLGEVAVFIKSDKKKISVIDSFKYQQIRISKVEKPEDTGFAAMVFDVTGIKCMINMTIKPLM